MYKYLGFFIMGLALASCREQPTSNPPQVEQSVTLDSVSSGTSSTLWAVSFPSAGTGYCVGNSGVLLRSYNAGSSWSLSTIESCPLTAVFFWSDTEGLVGGYGGGLSFILHTRNGLASWDSVMTFAVPHAFGGTPNGWLLTGTYGEAGLVYASTDTGRSWDPVAGTFKSVPVSAFAVQGGHWVATSPQVGPPIWGLTGGVGYSTGPDSSWQVLHDGGNWQGVSMDASGNAVAVGDSGQTLWSTDYGQSWTSVSSGGNYFLTGVAISSSGNIVAVGDSAILTGNVGSQSWTKLATPVYPLNAVTFLSSTKAVAVGMNGKIYTITFSSP